VFPVNFAFIEAVAGAFLAVLLGYKYIQSKKYHHLVWMFFLVFWSAFELGVFLHGIYGLTPITEKIVSLLHMPAMALSGLGMLFLLQGFELFPKFTIRKPWPKYFLIYTLIVYSILIGAVSIADMPETAITASWILLVVPGAFTTISGSISSFFLGRKRNLLIAIGLFLGVIGEQFSFLFQLGLDTIGETLMGLGFLITMEPPPREDKVTLRSP
jgi:hypothetical protein